MFGIGFGELLVILVVALLIFGPKRLPEVSRSLGKAMYQLRNASSTVTEEISKEWRRLEEGDGKGGEGETAATRHKKDGEEVA